MRQRTATLFYCDHCSKRKFQKPAMRRHEDGCTANPNRICKMCNLAGFVQKSIQQLDAAIHDWNPMEEQGEEIQKSHIRSLSDAAMGCPACMLAAVRQTKKSVDFDVDFKTESKKWIGEYGRKFPEDYQ